MAKYLITGGAGFIGSHLADKLLALGNDVTIFDNFSTGKEENVPKKAKIIKGDICDLSKLKTASEGQDAILHHAAQVSVPVSMGDPAETLEINAKGTLNVLIAAKDKRVKKVIYASSSAVYGDTERLPIIEEETLKPLSPYAVAKALGEYYCQVFSRLYNIDVTIFRYFNIFGERQDPSSQYSGAIAKFMKSAKEGTEISIYGNGKQTRDFIPVSKVVEANIRALSLSGVQILNIGSGNTITVNKLAETIIKAQGSKSQISHVEERKGDIKDSCANIEKAKTKLDFVPEYSLEKELLKI